MRRALTTWIWSLGVVARSYRVVIALAAFMALWGFSAYQWLGLLESSLLMLILALVWAIVQVLVTIMVVAGIVSAAGTAAAADITRLSLRSLGKIKARDFANALAVFILAAGLAWICGTFFGWVNEHALAVASFLAFHSQRAVSRVPVEEIFMVVEGLWWVLLSGVILDLWLAVHGGGWRAMSSRSRSLLVRSIFGTGFVTALLSVAVFGGISYVLVTSHPTAPPGFWDYAQMALRFSLTLTLISAGVLFWSLSLADLQLPEPELSQEPPLAAED